MEEEGVVTCGKLTLNPAMEEVGRPVVDAREEHITIAGDTEVVLVPTMGVQEEALPIVEVIAVQEESMKMPIDETYVTEEKVTEQKDAVVTEKVEESQEEE